MEPMIPKESAKLADMVMCGDHPSVTKTELNVREARPEDRKDMEKTKDRSLISSYGRLSPTTSRTDRDRATSEHALRVTEARRRRSLEAVDTGFELTAPPNRALIQAALGSFRWPPYLLVVWVLVLLVTHALHCLVGLLERTLPPLRKFCQYFRAWTEESWKGDNEVNGRLARAGLACVTGLLYSVYFGLYLVYSTALWSIEPLSSESPEDKPEESRLTDYGDANTKSCSSVKH